MFKKTLRNALETYAGQNKNSPCCNYSNNYSNSNNNNYGNTSNLSNNDCDGSVNTYSTSNTYTTSETNNDLPPPPRPSPTGPVCRGGVQALLLPQGGFEPLPVSPWPSPREGAGAPNTDRAYPSPHFAHKATSFIPRSSRPSSAW